MTDARLLARALADPPSVLALDTTGWTALLTMAKAERLAGSLAHRLAGLDLPHEVARVLTAARADAEVGRVHALWEAEMARRALAPLGVPVVLLKGTAFVAAGIAAGQGRLIGDLDILVPRDRLAEVEAALLAGGWDWVKPDPYDDDYYRRWMHELPPLIHRTRDRMIDVHHTILPLTARPTPDASALIAESLPLENGLRVLCPEDMVVHAVAHLFADGDLAGGLRNLWDIDRMLREFGADDAFGARLRVRAELHELGKQTARALRLREVLFSSLSPSGEGLGARHSVLSRAAARPNIPTPTPRPTGKRFWDASYLARLTARDGWGRETRKLLRLTFYIRSHWIRMPPLMLARHLWIKWRRSA